jgi:hypothetical protein
LYIKVDNDVELHGTGLYANAQHVVTDLATAIPAMDHANGQPAEGTETVCPLWDQQWLKG